MANLSKFKPSAVGHMLNHYSRKVGENVKRKNESIDKTRTHLNYDVHTGTTADKADHNKEFAVYEKRLSEVKHMEFNKRKGKYEFVTMCDWVITLPHNVPKERAEEFFKYSYEFCCKRYGKENVISAWVHMDETTPHMHFAFLPVVKDNDGTERLCAKQVITNFELTDFQNKLQEDLVAKMNQPVAILNGATVGGNLSITELKLRKALQELSALKAEEETLETLQPMINDFKNLMTDVEQTYHALDESLKTKKLFGIGEDTAKVRKVGKQLENIKATFERTKKIINSIEKTAEGFPEKVNSTFKKNLEILEEPIKSAGQAAARRIKRAEQALERKLKKLEEREKQLDEEVQQKVQQGIQKELHSRQAEIKALDEEIERKSKLADIVSRQTAANTALLDVLNNRAGQQEQQQQDLAALRGRSY